jgi:hypothetical protein
VKASEFLKQYRKQQLIEARLKRDQKSGEITMQGGIGSKAKDTRWDDQQAGPRGAGNGDIGRPNREAKKEINDFINGKAQPTKLENNSASVTPFMRDIKAKIAPLLKTDTVEGKEGDDEIVFTGFTPTTEAMDRSKLIQEFNKVLSSMKVPGNITGTDKEDIANSFLELVNKKYTALSVFGKAAEWVKSSKKGILPKKGEEGYITPYKGSETTENVTQKALANVLSKKVEALSKEGIKDILDAIDYDDLEGLSPSRTINKSEEEKQYDYAMAKKNRKLGGAQKNFQARKEMADKVWDKYFSKPSGMLDLIQQSKLNPSSTPNQIVQAAVKAEADPEAGVSRLAELKARREAQQSAPQTPAQTQTEAPKVGLTLPIKNKIRNELMNHGFNIMNVYTSIKDENGTIVAYDKNNKKFNGTITVDDSGNVKVSR